MQADKPKEETKTNQQKVTKTQKKTKKDDSRKVFDNIHGFIRFEKKIWKFIDTEEFQKLRYIKQLGCLSLVFPGATHTRFEHSLGTGHLAQTFIKLLILNNPERYEKLTEEQKESAIFTVTLAGIMHDVGHGPFSHTFDGEIVNTTVLNKPGSKQTKQQEWKHELGSELIFLHIVEKYKFLQKQIITKQEVQRVVRLIHGNSDGNREWEFELISNKQTGIDVDKLDYFRRDAFYLGAKGVQIDHELLMNEARILKEQKDNKVNYFIGYPSKYALQVNQIFYSRYKLYKTYYLNNISKGIEFMIMDVLKLVEPIFQFTDICRNIKQGKQWIGKYCGLTDGILERIQFLDQNSQKNVKYAKRIQKAKQILKRIKSRAIYKFVREVQTSITLQRLKKNQQTLLTIFNVDQISRFIEKTTNLSRQMFHIAVTEAGYGLKKKNPLDKVKFFRKQQFFDDNQTYVPLSEKQFSAENISILYTDAFAQRYAKLFVKGFENVESVKKINEAFVNYFDLKRKQCGDIFNHMNLGRTSFIATQTESRFPYHQLDPQDIP